jgi:DNA-binding transcriptional MocR family regulator
MQHSAIREILKVTQLPEVISFAGGLPAPELFPVARIAEATQRVLSTRGAPALQYSVTEGIPELRRWIAGRLNAQFGTAFTLDEVLVTTGSQQALDIYGRIMIDPGDFVVLENPSYLGAIQAFDAYQPEYLTVETDEAGIIPEALEEVLRKAPRRPKFLYLIPTFQNPTGRTLSAERRPKVVEICRRNEVPIFEDNPYGELAFSEKPPAPLIAHDGTGFVSYTGTASKIAAPGLRIGWMIVPEKTLRDKLIPAKQGSDLHTATLDQYILHELVTDGSFLEDHIALIRKTYGARRDVMLSALKEMMPEHVRFNHPAGGMFLWANVDPRIDTEELFKAAAAANVAFVPGRPFYPHNDRRDGMRLNFSNSDETKIRIGVERLATAIRNYGAGIS